MPTVKYPNGKLCQCGCGQPAARAITPDGRNKGYYKYATGHQPRPPLCDPKVQARARKAFEARIAVGTRRIKQVYGKQYWEIKIATSRKKADGRRTWMLEHRWIIEQRLGRRLKHSEHVHHRDDNGLNNGLHTDGKDNLVLLTAKEHMQLTNKGAKRDMCNCECPHCGARLKHFRRLYKRGFKAHFSEHDKAFTRKQARMKYPPRQ